MNVKIGTKIKALRKRDDITQEYLAEILGVTGQAVSKWESGNSYPDIEYIAPLANFFNVTTDFLFDHDTSEKRRKIDEYCEKYDAIGREWGKAQEQIDLMRTALAEFPAEEKLLIRLAKAIDSKWGVTYGYTMTTRQYTDGWDFPVWDYKRHRSYENWEEAVKIMEELLANSTDDKIRSDCRRMLVYIYARSGEKERAMEIANQCDEIYVSKESLLAEAFDGKDAVLYKQKLLITLLNKIRELMWFLANSYIKDKDVIDESVDILVKLNKHIYKSCDYGFYHHDMKELYINYSWTLFRQNRIDEMFEALENAYEHAKGYDAYQDERRTSKELKYTSPYLDMITETKERGASARMLPYLLKILENKDYYKKLQDDPRYIELVSRIKADIAEA
ncbi:MAG: helix-turn-helix domain-containing protein [Oscillospiraceae bacterium]|nr:helix-turn-helix domain-containing protein [Oscillospiraceae bacterium]